LIILLLRDLAAHRESYYNGRVLHRDISAGNIVIYNGGGLLIDWDMSKDLDLNSDDKNITRTVSYIFLVS
jgi:RIO-like serine/threonine protein kinase